MPRWLLFCTTDFDLAYAAAVVSQEHVQRQRQQTGLACCMSIAGRCHGRPCVAFWMYTSLVS